MGRPGDARPGGRLLGDRDDARHPAVRRCVDLLQERHGLQVLPAAELVGRPLALLARVVEVEHRGDRVHPQAVDVELLEPVQRVGDEEVAHLGAAVVEDERAPVLLLAAPRVGVLVERGAVEVRERPGVLGEVGGHPVDDDADAGLVQGVDEVPEVVRAAEAGRGREVRRHLVAPGPAERVLGHRHQLDVGEPEVGHVPDQLVGELAVGQALPPGAEVHLVGAHRGLQRVARGTAAQPLVVAPLVLRGEHHRRRRGRDLGAEGERVGLLPPHPVLPENLVLVVRAVTDAGDEQLPDAGRAHRPHRVGPAVPVVEVAGQADALRAGGPHREGRALHGSGDPVVGAGVRAEHVPELLVATFADQVQVDLAQRRQEPVRVVDQPGRPVVGDLQAVVRHLRRGQHRRPRRHSSRAASGGARRPRRPSPRSPTAGACGP